MLYTYESYPINFITHRARATTEENENPANNKELMKECTADVRGTKKDE